MMVYVAARRGAEDTWLLQTSSRGSPATSRLPGPYRRSVARQSPGFPLSSTSSIRLPLADHRDRLGRAPGQAAAQDRAGQTRSAGRRVRRAGVGHAAAGVPRALEAASSRKRRACRECVPGRRCGSAMAVAAPRRECRGATPRNCSEIIADMRALTGPGCTRRSGHGERAGGPAARVQKNADAIDLFNKALSMIPADRAPLARADLLIAGAQLPEVLSREDWVTAVAEVTVAPGTCPAAAGGGGAPADTGVSDAVDGRGKGASPLERLRAVLERALGADHPEAIKLSLAEMMLRSLETPLRRPRWTSCSRASTRPVRGRAAGQCAGRVAGDA